MKDLKKTLTKGTLGTVAAGAMALATATPAMADDKRGDKISAGDVIAGALIIGGVAAAAGVFDKKRDYRDRRYRDRRYNDRTHRDGNWDRGYNRIRPRQAVNRCTRAAERQARRFGGYEFAQVTRIRDVDRTRRGFKVKGRIEVEGQRGYARGHGNRGYDRGKFTCYFDGNGRPYIDFDGIRGLR